MNKKAILGIMAVLILVVAAGIWVGGPEEEPLDTNDNDSELNDSDNDVDLSVAQAELDRLPQELTIRGRTINFDRDSIVPESREEYAELPYQVEVGDEVRLVETDVEWEPGESPIEYVERFLEERIPPEEELDAYTDEMYQYSASFYLLDEEIAAEYPAADQADARAAQEGVSAYVRSMNFPDDSVGGSENRYDFIVTEDGDWVLVWIGNRSFCRRPGREFWQPADQLCP